MTDARVLVAGIGNVFLGDDGFGVEVARRLSGRTWPAGVRVEDFGIRGLHLALDLLEHRYETTVLVDAASRGGAPGDVYLIEPDLTGAEATRDAADAHGMTPDAVFALLRNLGGTPGRVLIVGCEPENLDEGIGLSEPVDRAVDEAIRVVSTIIEEATHVSGNTGEDRRVL